jgi:hypothetical protein
MRKPYWIWILPLVLALSSGCAGISVRPVAQGHDNETVKGIRFYQSAPYLLIVTDNKGGVTTQVLYLPDTNRLMSAYLYNKVATSDSTLKFKNGVLTSAVVEVDTAVVPKAILNAIATAAAAAFNQAGGGQAKLAPGPYLYRIKVEGNSATLIGSNQTLVVRFGTAPEKG